MGDNDLDRRRKSAGRRLVTLRLRCCCSGDMDARAMSLLVDRVFADPASRDFRSRCLGDEDDGLELLPDLLERGDRPCSL